MSAELGKKASGSEKEKECREFSTVHEETEFGEIH